MEVFRFSVKPSVCSGGRAEACFSRGPPQSLHRPRDSLKHLPVQIPHRLDMAKNRLSSPATGMADVPVSVCFRLDLQATRCRALCAGLDILQGSCIPSL